MDIGEVKKLILKIRDLESCAVVLDDNEEIKELHVVSNCNRSPKQISRDIQSVMKSSLNIDIDHKKISIAQLENIDMEEPNQFRLKIKKIERSITDSILQVKVVLEKNNKEYEAMLTGNSTSYNALRLLANATLDAVKSFLEKENVFSFEEVRKITIAGTEVILVSCAIIEGVYEKKLFGCAKIEADINEAVVKATLSAINRKLSMIKCK